MGYHGDYEYLGKTAARRTTSLNWLPARLTGRCSSRCWRRRHAAGARRGAARAPARPGGTGPNKLVTICAMAGALGVRLEKPGVYASARRITRSSLPSSVRPRPWCGAPGPPPSRSAPAWARSSPGCAEAAGGWPSQALASPPKNEASTT